MEQFLGFSKDSGLVCRLHKALCGLKQGPHASFDKLKGTFLTNIFIYSKCDPSLFIYTHNSQIIYMLDYVDDIIITGTSSTLVHDIITRLHSNFALKQLGELDYFLVI